MRLASVNDMGYTVGLNFDIEADTEIFPSYIGRGVYRAVELYDPDKHYILADIGEGYLKQETYQLPMPEFGV